VDKTAAKLIAPLASLVAMVNADGKNVALDQALMEFKEVLSDEYDFDDLDDITMSADERETAKIEAMTEEEMMMSGLDDEDIDDDLDDW